MYVTDSVSIYLLFTECIGKIEQITDGVSRQIRGCEAPKDKA